MNQDAAAPWESPGLRIAFSLAAATLNFLPLWRILLYARDVDLYFTATRYVHDYAAALALTVALAAVIFAALAALRRAPAGGRPWAILLLTALLAVAPLNFARVVASGYGIGVPQLAVAALVLGPVLAGVLLWRRQHPARAAFYAVAIFAPLAILYLAQAFWLLVASGSAPRSDAATAVVEPPAVDGPRVVWVVFDELDGRALRERAGGIETPHFDALAAESVQATAVVPPGGPTLRAMPAFWLGRPVGDSQPVGGGSLQVTVESGEPRSLGELDHVYRLAFERGHAIGLAGFYHPYCRLFGAQAVRCVDFAYRDVAHRESNGFADSLRLGATALLPYWQRLGGVRIYREIAEDGMAMAADPGLDFVTIHTNVPHDPPKYDPVAEELTALGRRASYASSLVLADRMLGELREAIDSAGLSERTHLVVTADHGWRGREGHESQAGAIPLFVESPGAAEGRVVAQRFEAVQLRDLMLALLEGEVADAAAVEQWLRRHSGG